MIKLLLIAFVGIFVSGALGKTYNGYKVYEVRPHTKTQADELISWESRVGIDFWSEPKMLGAPSLIMVNPENLYDFQHFLNHRNLTWSIKVDDVERMVESEKIFRRKAPSNKSGFSFDAFHRHDVMMNYLESLAERYPDFVTVKTEGESYEGRPIKSILISDKKVKTNKTLMILDGGIHAREWIASAFCMYVVQQMAVNRRDNMDILNKVDWLIVPMLNPDGYEYTHTDARFWRKTRKPNEGAHETCSGVDGNRNYDFHWGEKGGSHKACEDIYSGPHAASEPEVRIMSAVMMKYAKPGRTMYLSFHSFGYWLLYPWSFITQEEDPNRHVLQRVGELAAEAIYRKTGAVYTVGNTVDLLYPAAGGSHDFAMGKAGIHLAFTYELPPRSDRITGFVIDPKDILSICEETWHGVRAMALYLGYNH